MGKWISLTAAMLLCIVIMVGCNSRESGPTIPSAASNQTVGGSRTRTHLWGYYNVLIDPETQGATVIYSRSAMFAVNVVAFLNAKPTSLAVQANGVTVGPDYVDVDIDVSITHPFPLMPKYDGYDVRGIFMGDGSPALIYAGSGGIDQVMYDYGLTSPDPHPGAPGMPDGYTRWWNPEEFPSPGLYGYTPPMAGSPGYEGTATLNPHKYFADGLAVEDDLWGFLTATADDGVFSSGSTNTRNYYLRFPIGPAIRFGYAVVANWAGATVHPANASEAVGLKVDVTPGVYYVDETENGGDLILDVSVFDWDSPPVSGVMTEYRLIVESSVLSMPYYANSTEMQPTGSGADYCIYHLEIPADDVQSVSGNQFWVIAECSDENYTNPYGVPNDADTDKLAACFRYDLDVAPCKYASPADLVTMAQAVVDAHSAVMDDVTVSFRSLVSSSSLDDDLDEIVDGFAIISWEPSPTLYRIDLTTIPDPATLEQFRQNGKDYLSSFVSECDSLFNVQWTPDPSSGIDPFTTVAVVSPDGTVRYEPFGDMEVVLSEEPNSTPKDIEGWNRQVWKNLAGVPKVTTEISIQALGADGCHASFTASFISSAGWPFVVEPSSANPTPVKWCFQKYECTCDVKPGVMNLMECATATQSYSVIARIGIDPIAADVVSYPGSIQAWACADGQCGAGSGQG